MIRQALTDPLNQRFVLGKWQHIGTRFVNPSQAHAVCAALSAVCGCLQGVIPAATRLPALCAQSPCIDPLSLLAAVSESDVPLYPALLIWRQLMGEQESRTFCCTQACLGCEGNFRFYGFQDKWRAAVILSACCSHDLQEDHPNFSSAAAGMWGMRLRAEHWRKSGQWFTLTRQHAQV